MRAAKNRSRSVPIARSLVGTREKDGIVRHAGTPDGSANPDSAAGRCDAAITAAVRAGRSAAKMSWKTAGLMIASWPVVPSGSGNGRTSSVAGRCAGWAADRPRIVSPWSGAYAAT